MSTSDKIKSNDGICEVNEMLQNMNTNDTEVVVCANCGRTGRDINNICNKCNQVRYCNAVCKKKHRHKHKKDCEEHNRLAAERAAELHEIELFKQPPSQYGDCPICFERLPTLADGYRYQTCCGKLVCCGCAFAPVYDDQGNEVDNNKCPFCRTPDPRTNEEAINRLKKRVELDDPIAIYNQGMYYREGTDGFPQDMNKALELFHRAVELGYSEAYTNIGVAHHNGQGVEVDKKKMKHYYERAAMMGDPTARHNLALDEKTAGNFDRALKHYMIAVRGGYTCSLDAIKLMYTDGDATRDDYTKALQAYQTYLGEIKSVQRDKAAAADEENRYY